VSISDKENRSIQGTKKKYPPRSKVRADEVVEVVNGINKIQNEDDIVIDF
jgi:hypothetical protein